MDGDEATDLTFASIDELLNELGKRSHSCVWVGLLKTDETDDEQALTFQFHGGRWTCLGLMADATGILRDRKHEAD